MGKLLKVLKGATEVLTTAGAVLAAAIVVVETYQTLRKKMDSPKGSYSAAGICKKFLGKKLSKTGFPRKARWISQTFPDIPKHSQSCPNRAPRQNVALQAYAVERSES